VRRAWTVNALVGMAASLVTGFFLGWLITSIWTYARISRSQQRMQRIVLYWQAEVRRLTAEVEYLTSGPRPGAANPYLGPPGS
jgi:hypothetical protein